ncbi:MAG: alpha-glucan family phosphorylase [Planctomycetes bacterium]|nr:alpha-glucan family phosphorylase [Planctomycetota bacterium]
MRVVRPFTVVPLVPKPVEALREIAYNLWWTWNQDARELFVRIDGNLWAACGHNPVALLGRTSQKRLLELAQDDGFLAHLERVHDSLRDYLSAKTWYDQAIGDRPRHRIAYFSAEFGLHECLPVYSGGLGLLAGDHLKSASGLGLPLVGVGLAYYNGYCRQYLNADGWQQEYLAPNEFHSMPATLEKDAQGKPVRVSVQLPNPDREVWFQIWRVRIGRVSLYLLDSKIDQNRAEDRSFTDQLYGGNYEHRFMQELALGIGGLRALRALGLDPDVCHMNEGHSAFLAVERIRTLMEEHKLSFEQAREAVIAGNVFTTHTPVPAGIDRFGTDLIDRYFGSWFKKLGIDRRTFLAMGRQYPHDEQEPFSMAVLALKTAGGSNGVSALHGEVSRRMWQGIWPEVPEHDLPIDHITNGVHVRSYVSDPLNELFVRYAGARWSYEAAEEDRKWNGPELLPDGELWRVHERCRANLVSWARKRVKQQLTKRGAGPREIEEADELLDPEALTIGFARRFATYKRATLLFHDPDRLAALLNMKDRPVQILFAGKAHPKDDAGKAFIQKIVKFAREERFRKHIVFLEDYDITTARYLVQGVDVWLNTPRRPHEASGTSGMKAAANGVLNCSILDGWWCEGYDGTNGWAIGAGEDYEDEQYQDNVESRALYDLLEKQVVQEFFQRGRDDLPRAWIKRMKRTMQTCIPTFSTHRMVRDYAQKFYLPSGERWAEMTRDHCQAARDLWDWKMTLFQKWAQIRIEEVQTPANGEIAVGSALDIVARVHLGPIKPEWVDVQVFVGPLNDQGQIVRGQARSMVRDGSGNLGEGFHLFRSRVDGQEAGRFGFAVRVIPRHANMSNPYVPGLITWA